MKITIGHEQHRIEVDLARIDARNLARNLMWLTLFLETVTTPSCATGDVKEMRAYTDSLSMWLEGINRRSDHAAIHADQVRRGILPK